MRFPRLYLLTIILQGDHPKTAEAIARKINLILGDTRESLAKKTNRALDQIYEDEFSAIVVHGDDIDGLQGWQWDQSMYILLCSTLINTQSDDVVFSKEEIVFARTSPKHKLEIGGRFSYYICSKMLTSSF